MTRQGGTGVQAARNIRFPLYKGNRMLGSVAKKLDDLLGERPGNSAARAAHRQRMLAEVRGYRLRELREMLALTQTDLADALGISQKRVSEIERGQVEFTKVDTLRRYAEALGASLRIDVQVGDVSYRIAGPRVEDSTS